MTGNTLRKNLYQLFGDDDELLLEKTKLSKNKLDKLFASMDVKSSEISYLSQSLDVTIEKIMNPYREGIVDKTSIGEIAIDTNVVVLKESQTELDFYLPEGLKLEYFVVAYLDSENLANDADIYPVEKYWEFDRSRKGDYIYFLFKNNTSCEIRHRNPHYTWNKEFIGEYGFRISVEGRTKLYLRLYNGNKIEKEYVVSFNDFCIRLKDILDTYQTRVLEIHEGLM